MRQNSYLSKSVQSSAMQFSAELSSYMVTLLESRKVRRTFTFPLQFLNIPRSGQFWIKTILHRLSVVTVIAFCALWQCPDYNYSETANLFDCNAARPLNYFLNLLGFKSQPESRCSGLNVDQHR